MLVLRDGTTQDGRFVNMTGGDTLFWENSAGQQQRYAIQAIARVYLNAQSARTVFNYTPPASTPAPSSPDGVSVRVDAQQQWVDSGLTVRQGDVVTFRASGQIQTAPGQTVTPDGDGRGPSETNRRSSPRGRSTQRGYPAPDVAVGALLGKVGDGTPFGIGTQTQPMTMTASGRLMLGVNDTNFGDNSGAFTVVVTTPNDTGSNGPQSSNSGGARRRR